MNVPVLTISSRVPHEPYYFYHQFIRSCRKQGIEPVFLPTETWRGLCSKPKILLSYLEKEGSKFDRMVFCDAWDIIFARPLGDILSEANAFDKPIVFNAERNCFPRADLADKHNESPTPYRFLNSGFMVGKTEAIVDMLREMKSAEIPDDYKDAAGQWHHTNDQQLFMEWYVEHKDKAALDTEARICQSLHASEPTEFWFEVPGNYIWSYITKQRPCVFHGNGSGKDWLKKVIQWLGV